jgi:hypothetical protein
MIQMWSMEKMLRTATQFAVYMLSCYLLCAAIVSLVVFSDYLNNPDMRIFPNTRVYDRWMKRILWELGRSDLLWDKLYVVAVHASAVLMNHMWEILALFATGCFVPIQGKTLFIVPHAREFVIIMLSKGIAMSLAPSWAVDAIEGMQAAMTAGEDENVPPLEEDPAFTELSRTHDIYVNGVRLTSDEIAAPLKSASVINDAELSSEVVERETSDGQQSVDSDSSETAANGPKITGNSPNRSRLPSLSFEVAAPADQLVFDPVFGVVSKELRDRWRKQERDSRVALEAAAARRRQTLVPPVRYSTLASADLPSVSTKGDAADIDIGSIDNNVDNYKGPDTQDLVHEAASAVETAIDSRSRRK